MFFESMSPWRNRVSSALAGPFGSGERMSRLQQRRRASGGVLGIERLEDRRLLAASPIAPPPFIVIYQPDPIAHPPFIVIYQPVGVVPLQSPSPVGPTPAQIR